MRNRPASDPIALVIAAAWLDAELFTRCGVRSTAHSAALLGFTGAGAQSKLARPDSLTAGQAAGTVAAIAAAPPDWATRKPALNSKTPAPVLLTIALIAGIVLVNGHVTRVDQGGPRPVSAVRLETSPKRSGHRTVSLAGSLASYNTRTSSSFEGGIPLGGGSRGKCQACTLVQVTSSRPPFRKWRSPQLVKSDQGVLAMSATLSSHARIVTRARPIDPEDCIGFALRFPTPVELRLAELAQAEPAAFLAALADSIEAIPHDNPATLDTIQGIGFALSVMARAVQDGGLASLLESIRGWNLDTTGAGGAA